MMPVIYPTVMQSLTPKPPCTLSLQCSGKLQLGTAGVCEAAHASKWRLVGQANSTLSPLEC